MSEINQQLREHVTRVGFDLNLTKTQIAALVWLDLVIKGKYRQMRRPYKWSDPLGPIAQMANRNWVIGMRACISKGLAEHHYVPPKRDSRGFVIPYQLDISKYYKITKAGRLCLDLLKEAGVYQDYAAPIVEELLPVPISTQAG